MAPMTRRQRKRLKLSRLVRNKIRDLLVTLRLLKSSILRLLKSKLLLILTLNGLNARKQGSSQM